VHKRLDPMYADARDRIRELGPFSYMYSYMSQPKHQLDTFRKWAGIGSDVSYYLNSHHIDFHCWALLQQEQQQQQQSQQQSQQHNMCVVSRPIVVTATASTGVASKRLKTTAATTTTAAATTAATTIEDSITLTVLWLNLCDGSTGTAVYTSSWTAPTIAEVHSQQRFHYAGQCG